MNDLIEEKSVLEFKGRMLMMTILHLQDLDLERVQYQLRRRINESQDWLHNVPIVVDVDPDAGDITDQLPAVLALLRDHDLNLVALARSAAIDERLSIFLGLPSITLSKQGGQQQKSVTPRKTEPSKPVSNLLVDQPVRSGQQIYSPGDLIVTSSVGTGAELLAEGNIHVYGNLRGRALAGVRGNENARIFCQQLNAELVSIAGHYRVAEGLPDESVNHSVQISLAGESMVFTPLSPK